MQRAQDRARSATIKSRVLGVLKLASEARDENVPARRADCFYQVSSTIRGGANRNVTEWGFISVTLESHLGHITVN